MTNIFLNLGYGLGIIAMAVKDVLWLRCILAISQFSLCVCALMLSNRNAAFWNLTFVIINVYHVVRLIRERRPIELPEKLTDLYDRVFSSMTRKEFLYFWQTGQINTVRDQVLIKQGDRQDVVSLILSGRVEVMKTQKTIAELKRGSFVAEMSFLTGEPASADVKAIGEVEFISWQQEKMRGLKQLNPTLFMKIQHLLGKDLAIKIKAASKDHSPAGK